MIVLDTNVLSELMKAAPADSVVRWVAAQPAAGLCTTSITQAEVLRGIMLLPPGKRRTAVEAAAVAMFEEEFGGRILPFDSDAAPSYARIAAQRRCGARPISHSTRRSPRSPLPPVQPSPPATSRTSTAAASR